MGMNSTDTAYNFGQFGSTYLTGSGAKLDLSGSDSSTVLYAKYYICAITVTEAVTFSTLAILDAGVNLGMGTTHFMSSDDTQTLDTDWGAATALGDNDGVVLTSSHEFPAGITLYGMWDNVVVNSGAVICYVAPRPDYKDRA
tara:strand:+ start:23 stop:448 length:426 start_codon:yes stop_codon:yes gene_type:complete